MNGEEALSFIMFIVVPFMVWMAYKMGKSDGIKQESDRCSHDYQTGFQDGVSSTEDIYNYDSDGDSEDSDDSLPSWQGEEDDDEKI